MKKLFTAKRLCRGTEICMTVRNPDGREAGAREIRVDGVLLEKPFLSWGSLAGKKQVDVEILL